MTGSGTGSGGKGPVRLRVIRVDLMNLNRAGTLLLDVEADIAEVFDQATAWAQVRGYTQLVAALDWFFANEAPADGYAALINGQHSVKIVVTWPWAPARLPPWY